MGSRDRVRARSLSWFRPTLPYGAIWVIAGFSPGPAPSKKCQWSKDGVTWEEAGTDSLPEGLQAAQGTVHDGRMWFAGGYYMPVPGRNQKVWYSTDGIVWDEAGLNSCPLGGIAQSVMLNYGGAMWLIGGRDGTGTQTRKVFWSTDGIIWTEAGVDALPVAIFLHAAIVYEGAMWITGGMTLTPGATKYPKVLRSTDGVNWSEQGVDACPNSVDEHAMCVYDGRIWISGGRNAAWAVDSDVYWSVDGIIWTKSSDLPVVMEAHTMMVHQGLMWAVGEALGTMRVYHSQDGVTWTPSGGVPTLAVTDHVSMIYPPTH